jgi:hypothetical protein
MNPVLLLESERDPRPAQREGAGMDDPVQVQIARLSSDVKHIETVVSDIKVDVRRIDGKLDSIDERVHQLDTRVYQVEQRVTEKMNNGFTAIRSDIATMKVWALGLYITLAGGLLFVMAKGFKWI